MTAHIRFINLLTLIAQLADKSKKITMHLGFVNQCTALAYDHNITNWVSEAKITMQIKFMNLCTAQILRTSRKREYFDLVYSRSMIQTPTLINNVPFSGFELVS